MAARSQNKSGHLIRKDRKSIFFIYNKEDKKNEKNS